MVSKTRLVLIGPADEGDLGGIAAAFTELIGLGVTAFAGGHAGTDFLEELVEGGLSLFVDDGGTEDAGGLATGMEVSTLGQGDEMIGQGLEFLGDAGGDFDFFLEDEVGHDVAEHGPVLRGGVARLEANAGLAVDVLSSLCCH